MTERAGSGGGLVIPPHAALRQRVCVSLAFVDEEAWFLVDPEGSWTVLQDTAAYLATRDPAIRTWRSRDPLVVELWPQVLDGPGDRALLDQGVAS